MGGEPSVVDTLSINQCRGSPVKDPPLVRVNLFGSPRITAPTGDEVVLSDRRRALLAALVCLDRPVERDALVAAVGIGRQTLGSLLSRVADDLGSERQIHRVVGSRSRSIELDRRVVDSDVEEARKLLAGSARDRTTMTRVRDLGLLEAVGDLGLVAAATVSKEIDDRLAQLQVDATRALAWFDLGSTRADTPLLADCALDGGSQPELWLARVDDIASRSGPREAERVLAAADDRLGTIESARGRLKAEPLCRLLIDTADVDWHGGPGEVTIDRQREVARAEDRRRASLIADGLDGGARLVFLHDPSVEPESIRDLVRVLRRRRRGAVGGWTQRGDRALSAMAELLSVVVAAQARSHTGGLSARMITTLLAVRRAEAPEPEADIRWFSQEISELLTSWSRSDRPLLVVGRADAVQVDLDRVLANLLRLDSRLALVVIHAEPEEERPEGLLEEFSQVRLQFSAMPAKPGQPPGDKTARGPYQLTGSGLSGAVVKRSLAVVSFSADDAGHIVEPLAEHLLDVVDSTVSVGDLRAASPERWQTDDPTRMTTPPDVLMDEASVSLGDRVWIGTEAINWLMRSSPLSHDEYRSLRRLAALVGKPNLPAGFAATLRLAATFEAGQGSFQQAVSMLDLAADIAPNDADQAITLTQRGDHRRQAGDWDQALADYRLALDRLPADSLTRRAELGLRMAQLTWDPAVGREVDKILRTVLAGLPPAAAVLRARINLCLAGGSYQDGSAGTDRVEADGIERSLGIVRDSFDPEARAWGLVHARKALLGVASATRSVQLAEEIISEAGNDVAILAHGYQATFVDRVRTGEWSLAADAVTRIEELARTPVSVEQQFSALVVQTCWDLAGGRFASAAERLPAELAFRAQLGGSTFDQVTLAHSIWLARERGDRAELNALATAAAELADADPKGAIWMAGAALLALDVGRVDDAVKRTLHFGRRVGGFDQVAQGAHRLPVLGITAKVAATAAALGRPTLGPADLEAIIDGLTETDVEVILIGWPTVLLGPVSRYLGMALAGAGRIGEARRAIARSGELDGQLPSMHRETIAAGHLVDQIARRR